MKRDYTGNTSELSLSSPAKKMMNSTEQQQPQQQQQPGQFYKTNEEIEVLHPSHNTAESDLLLRILSETGESRCLVPLDKRHMCNEIPYLNTLCQNVNAYQTPQEIEFTIPGLDQLSHIREFFTAVYTSNTTITVENCFDMYRIAKAFDCIEIFGKDAENHIRSHISLETILETNLLGKEFTDDCNTFLETIKRQLASQNGAGDPGVNQAGAQKSQQQSGGQQGGNNNQVVNQQASFTGARKMKICQYFMNGTCQRSAEQCNYAHGPQDLAPGAQQQQNGFNNNFNNGVFNSAGSSRKTRLCNQFMQQGRCTKGPQCTYAHGTHQLASFRNPGDNPGVKFHKTKLCKHFMQEGNCQHGTNCSYAHGEHELNTPAPTPNFNNSFNAQTNFSYNQTFSNNSGGKKQLLKLKLCHMFQQKGFCSKQDNCTFAHGEHELNTPQPSNNSIGGAGGAGAGGAMSQTNNPKAMAPQNFGEMTYFG